MTRHQIKRVAVMGSGFAGLSAAAYLSKEGFITDVYEKNETIGGRARQLKTDNGYVFDMGPSWYWMPDVFDRFFKDFGYQASDFYKLKRLDPSFSVIFGQDDVVDVPANTTTTVALGPRTKQVELEATGGPALVRCDIARQHQSTSPRTGCS